VGKDLDKPIVQYVVRGIHISRITEAYRQHLFGVDGVKRFPSRITSRPTAFDQFYLIFQCQLPLKVERSSASSVL
jgi:hypothetical protein